MSKVQRETTLYASFITYFPVSKEENKKNYLRFYIEIFSKVTRNQNLCAVRHIIIFLLYLFF